MARPAVLALGGERRALVRPVARMHARFVGDEEAEPAGEAAPVVREVALGQRPAAAEVGHVGTEQDAVGSGAAAEGQRLEEPHGPGIVLTAQLMRDMHTRLITASVRQGGAVPSGRRLSERSESPAGAGASEGQVFHDPGHGGVVGGERAGARWRPSPGACRFSASSMARSVPLRSACSARVASSQVT